MIRNNLEATTLTISDSGIAELTLNRPEAANARNQVMRNELSEIYTQLSDDPTVRVLVLRGAGDRFFCAGMDLKESRAPESTLERRSRLRGSRDIEQLAAFPRPTIAVISGYALGGGLEMALACDLRIAASDAVVGLTEIQHGLIPGGGGTQRLPRLAGWSKATEMILLGTRLSGTEAFDAGIVNWVLPREEINAFALSVATKLAESPPAALSLAKESIRASMEMPLRSGVERELDSLLFLMSERS
jgi:enoyl-CoA hydratase/carnithine racemase